MLHILVWICSLRNFAIIGKLFFLAFFIHLYNICNSFIISDRWLENLAVVNKSMTFLHFKFDTKAFLSSTAGKWLEKCLLKFPIVRFLRSLDPRVIGGSTSTSVIERLLSLLDAN